MVAVCFTAGRAPAGGGLDCVAGSVLTRVGGGDGDIEGAALEQESV